MYGKEVCILQKGDELVLQCFMQCINCSHCPPGNKTPFLFCLSQLFRINCLLLVHTPPLLDTDVLDHPGLNTSILESSTSSTFIQITTIHVFLQSSTPLTFVQITTIHVFLQSLTSLFTTKREPLGYRVPLSSGNAWSLAVPVFQGATSSLSAGPVQWWRFLISTLGATSYPS